MSGDRRDHSSYTEISSGIDITAGTMHSPSSSPEIGPTSIPSRSGSPAITLQEAPKQKERGRVRFHNKSEMSDSANKRASLPLEGSSKSPTFEIFPGPRSQTHSRTNSVASLLQYTFDGSNDIQGYSPDRTKSSRVASPSPIRRPQASVLRNNSYGSLYRGDSEIIAEEAATHEKASSALRAHERYVYHAKYVDIEVNMIIPVL